MRPDRGDAHRGCQPEHVVPLRHDQLVVEASSDERRWRRPFSPSQGFTWQLPLALQTDTFNGSAGEGRVSSAARADYAKAAAAVLAGGNHAGKTYELAGDASFTMAERAAVATEAAGKPIAYQNMAAENYRTAAITAGIPEMFAMVLSDADAGIEGGAIR